MKLEAKRGIDVGNINLKITDADKAYIIPNVISEIDEPVSINTTFLRFKKDEMKNQIDVLVNGKRVQLGNLAIKNGGRERGINAEKNSDADIKIQTPILLAYEALKDKPGTTVFDASVYTSLPIREFKRKEKIQNYIELIAGENEVEFLSGDYAGNKIKVKVREDNIEVFPEGVLALFNILTTKECGIRPEYQKLIGSIIIVVDIGGGTIDIAGLEVNKDENGTLDLNIVNELVDFIPEGVLNIEDKIIRRLKEKEYEISAAELDEIIRDSGCILDNGEDISDEVEKHVRQLAVKATKNVMDRINALPAIRRRKIKKIFTTGGGSLLPAGNAEKNLGELVNEALESNDYHAIESENPLFDGVKGMKKLIDMDEADEKELKESKKGDK